MLNREYVESSKNTVDGVENHINLPEVAVLCLNIAAISGSI